MGNRRARALVALVAIAAALELSAGAAAPPARDLFDTIYERGQPVASTLRTLTARFTETSESSLLARPLIARGTLALRRTAAGDSERPATVILRYTEPETRTLLIDRDLLLLDWPGRTLRQQQNIGAAQKRVERYFLDKGPDQLRSHFTISAAVATGREGTWLVQMVPKRKQISQGVARIDLWIAQSDVLLRAMRMTFPGGDTKLMEFEEVVLNPTLDERAFAVNQQ